MKKFDETAITESARRVHQAGEEHHRGAGHVLRGGAARARAGRNGEFSFVSLLSLVTDYNFESELKLFTPNLRSTTSL